MKATKSTKTVKSINDIWDDSHRLAFESIRTDDMDSIARMMNVDTDKAVSLNTLNAEPELQLKYLALIGKKAVIKITDIKHNSVELYEMNSIDDWNNLKQLYGNEYSENFPNLFCVLRYSKRTRGKYRMEIILEDVNDE